MWKAWPVLNSTSPAIEKLLAGGGCEVRARVEDWKLKPPIRMSPNPGSPCSSPAEPCGAPSSDTTLKLMFVCWAQVCAAWRMTFCHLPARLGLLLKVEKRLLV